MYRLVDCDTWNDPWFEGLEPDAKLFFLYLITNPRSTSAGAFEITARKMAFETGIAQERIEAWLGAWAPRVRWWPEHQIVFLKNFYRRQSNSEKVQANAKKIVVTMPVEVRKAIYEVYPEWRDPEDTLSIPYADPRHKQDKTRQVVNETETSTPPTPPAGDAPAAPKAKRPTRIDPAWEPDAPLRAWCAGKQFGPAEVAEQTERFRDYYVGKGEARADWNASFRNWMTSPIRERERLRAPARASPNGHGEYRATAAGFARLAGMDVGEERR